MQKINSETDLKLAILQLESRQADEVKLLREQFQNTYNGIKPLNLIKSTILEAVGSKDIKDNVLNSTIGMAVGYLSKMMFVGRSRNPLTKVLGSVLMFGITNVIIKHPETVKSVGNGLINLLRSKHSNRVHKTENIQSEETVSWE